MQKDLKVGGLRNSKIMSNENTKSTRPLADRMRPENFQEFVGQEDIVGSGKLLRKLIELGDLSSIILWGPPGTGKTTLANIISKESDAEFHKLSAVMSGKKDLRTIIDNAKFTKKKTVLFIDEIHRWNKAQQDALLPYVEDGTIILIGATTENPSFEIIGALLSRSRIFVLKSLEEKDLIDVVNMALKNKEGGLGNYNIEIEDEVIELLAELSGGDARTALNGLELAFKSKIKDKDKGIKIDRDDIKESLQRTQVIFDKKGSSYYSLISALHKSMRGGDSSAALYWLARMVEAGCDPLYVARRVLRFASEDIGMANSQAMVQANTAFDACHKLGFPECNVHLAQAVVYCAKSKKSNLLYRAYEEAAIDARSTSHIPVPLHLINAPTKMMQEMGYGKDYQYNPDVEGEVVQDYLPKELLGKNYLEKKETKMDVYYTAQKKKNKK